ncbi:extracellular solute-binding protein family 1 [[Leptolyngbya] sp. PCC 7376]|uniref:Fe(3+) ABC transporter substrate-binding protein n=1 Tax=[Leptolyngbya] sp. PCC 7376 TaxID=111781 RepID=UPI00029EE763|nr:Fe(3+) ABC transporter substrate-binding protein [[Leptolyngbya] sp. PCC 7376]AFY37119.1 extracellular solute-binding protein family 1 [[Leptolyngbya] sp. PCC 7376]
MKIRFATLCGAAISAALFTVGCTPETPTPSESDTTTTSETESTDTDADADAGELNLYSSRHYDSDAELYDNFSQATGIKINLIEGKDDELLERLKTEGENSPADVLITVDIARLWRAQSEGLLQETDSEALISAIPENLRSTDNTWFGLTKRARIIVYNTEAVDEADLTTYEDLADPKWAGRFCVRSSSNTYNQSLVASKIVELGEEATEAWAKGLVSNFAREPEGNDTAQIKAVAAGECDLALVNSYYVARLRSSDDQESQEIIANIGAFFPNQEAGGTHVNISGAGMMANAPNPEQAQEFLEFMVTPEAQEIFANNNNEYPVIAEIEPNEVVAQFGDWQASDLPLESFGEKNADAVKLMDRAGWK